MKFKRFTPDMCDKVYSTMDVEGHLCVKTSEGDVLNASLQWREGRGNNYYFESTTFGFEIELSCIEEIAYAGIED